MAVTLPSIHIPQNISAPFAATRAAIRQATRLMLEDVFKFWRQRYAPRHFERRAFASYKSYDGNYKKNYRDGATNTKTYRILTGKIKNHQDTPLPMVKTGAGRNAFLSGPVKFKGTFDNLTAVFIGLPKYMYMYKKTQFNKHSAMREVNAEETASMIKFGASRIGFHLNRSRGREKSYGLITAVRETDAAA